MTVHVVALGEKSTRFGNLKSGHRSSSTHENFYRSYEPAGIESSMDFVVEEVQMHLLFRGSELELQSVCPHWGRRPLSSRNHVGDISFVLSPNAYGLF